MVLSLARPHLILVYFLHQQLKELELLLHPLLVVYL